MHRTDPLLPRALQEPETVSGLHARGWERLIAEARGTGLIGRLQARLADAGQLERVPEGPRRHLDAAARVAASHQASAEREIRRVLAALQPLGEPVIFLKGAAYLVAGHPVARGRMFSDIDILMPREMLARVESELMVAGWVATHLDRHDQRYYRSWMHELPPLEHLSRGTTVDVHHTLYPVTGRLALPIGPVIEAAEPVPGWPGAKVLAPADQVLHSAVHLLWEGEFDHGLRDLSDIDMLLRHAGARAAFWEELPQRAAQLHLQRPLYYALRYARRLLGTPVPPEVVTALQAHAPGPPVRRLMDALFERVLAPPDLDDRGQALARQLLFLRGHWLKMPLHLLVYHLGHKALFPPREAAGARG